MNASETETIVAPVGQLQADIFCEGCGYNLHSQIVTRDERLNLLVCRCPECGRFAAAGQGSTIGRVWLNRFGTLILVVWLMFLFFGFGLATLFMGIMPYSHLRSFTHWEWHKEFDSHTQSMIDRGYYGFGRYGYGAGQVKNDEQVQNDRVAIFIFGAVAGAMAFLAGVFHAVFLWHVKGRWRLLALAFPLIGFAGAAMFWFMDFMSRYLHAWGMSRLAIYLLLECAGVLAGLACGRAIARALLRWFLPPKPRQHLAFLWTTDSKELPI
jgi:hypothetical protein